LGLFSSAVFIGAVLVIWAKYGGGGETVGGSALATFLVDKFTLVLALLPGEFGTVRSFFQ
jgi:membrane protein required for colicin V production